MLLIYYNPHHNHFYMVYINSIPFEKKVGYINKYDHILVQMLLIRNNKLYNVSSYEDYFKIKVRDETTKEKVINRLIRFLNKIK